PRPWNFWPSNSPRKSLVSHKPPHSILYVAVAGDSLVPILILAFHEPSSFLRVSCSGPGVGCPSAATGAMANASRSEPTMENWVLDFMRLRIARRIEKVKTPTDAPAMCQGGYDKKRNCSSRGKEAHFEENQ